MCTHVLACTYMYVHADKDVCVHFSGFSLQLYNIEHTIVFEVCLMSCAAQSKVLLPNKVVSIFSWVVHKP